MIDWTDWEHELNRRFEIFLEIHSSHIHKASLINSPEESVIISEAWGPSHGGPDSGIEYIPPYIGWDLPLETLRRIPRYLCAITLLSDLNPIDQGHYEYWRYTGVYAGAVGDFLPHVISKDTYENQRRLLAKRGVDVERGPVWYTIPATRWQLNDLCLLIGLALLGVQKMNLRMEQAVELFRNEQSHTILTNLIQNSFNITTKYGFPVLESLAGNWGHESTTKLQGHLELWIDNTDNDATSALPTVDSLGYLL